MSATISISPETKERLESIRGDKSWDELLNELYQLYVQSEKVKGAKEFEKEFPMSDEEADEELRMLAESRRRWMR